MTRLSSIALLLVAFCASLGAQTLPKALLSDEFENVFCTDPLRARIDNFFTEISNHSGSAGYVIAFPDASLPGRSERQIEVIRSHAAFRNFDLALLHFLKAQPADSTRFQFWIVPKGAQPPRVDTEVSQIVDTTLFDASRIATVKQGRVEFGEEWANEPCGLGLNLSHFAAWVRANKDSTAYLLTSARNTRDVKKSKLALRLTAASLATSHRIPRSRIRTIYAGRRRESVMQLWLVPKGGMIPKYRPGTVE